MSARADALAARLAEVSGQAIEVIERIPDERWGTTCEAEGWTVAATARHWTALLPCGSSTTAWPVRRSSSSGC
ncbi:MAG TPA: hypothetical protein VMU89_13930 [Thermomicrobiaceae bacterium]|nr:hypothetical protein [Thermomicrobiaceae bacterium]